MIPDRLEQIEPQHAVVVEGEEQGDERADDGEGPKEATHRGIVA